MTQSKIWCFSLCILCLGSLGCADIGKPRITQSGYALLGIYPKHNESILNHYGGITDAIAEVYEKIEYGNLALILNPTFLAGGDWPHDARPTRFGNHPQWVYADLKYGLEIRLGALPVPVTWSIGYLKERSSELWHDQTGATMCNCTYSNLWYLRAAW